MDKLISILDLQVVDILLRFLEAIVISSIVGLDREKTRRPAGLRTHVIVTLGACVVTLACLFYPDGHSDNFRIPAQVLSGIGFIGAGTILRYKDNVVGLTTAASLWTCAAFGICAGLGAHDIVIIGGILFILVLKIVPGIERKYLKKVVDFNVSVMAGDNQKDLAKVSELIKQYQIELKTVNVDLDKYGNKLYYFTLGAKNDDAKNRFMNDLYLLDLSRVREDKDEYNED
ncbi:MAG: MgtC/SapB family protein [Clostridia bacterium]|nr:MgtC/SapB family protein [Clostridia bacterium]